MRLDRFDLNLLVVLDTLSKMFAMSGIDVNDSGKVEPALGKLSGCEANLVANKSLIFFAKSLPEFKIHSIISENLIIVLL